MFIDRRRPRPLFALLLLVVLCALRPASAGAQGEQPPPDFALMQAVMDGDAAAAQRAIARGGVRTTQNPPALLQMALLQGRPEIVRLLLDAGVPAAARSGDAESPLFLALTNSRQWTSEARLEIVRMLLAHGAKATEPMHQNMTTPGSALTYAALNGYSDIVELLVANGASIATRDEGGHTLLGLVASADATEVPLDDRLATARTLVRLGADPSVRDGDGHVPAEIAEERGAAQLAALLRDRRALASAPAARQAQRQRPVAAPGMSGSAVATPEARLMIAIVSDDVAMARQAVDDGAELTATSERGQTALMAAASMSRPAIVRLLLDRGADPNAVPQPGRGNAANAAFAGPNLFALRESAGAERERAVEVVRLIAARRPMLDLPVKYGMSDVTPLMQAMEYGGAEVVRLLLDAGARPDAPTSMGVTPLVFVLERGTMRLPESARMPIVQALVDAGANVNRVTRGQRPLQLARASGYPRLAQILEKAGAR